MVELRGCRVYGLGFRVEAGNLEALLRDLVQKKGCRV